MTSQLSDIEVARYLREKAQKYLEVADMLEGKSKTAVPPANTSVTVDKILAIMGGKNKRQGDVVKALGVPVEEVAKVMTEGNGFIPLEQGWYSHSTFEQGT